MPRQAGIKLSNKQKQNLKRFMKKTKDAREYRATLGILLRAENKTAEFVAQRLEVTIKQVFAWCKKFKDNGVEGLLVKKQTGRPAKEGNKAKKIIPELIKQDPQSFGFIKGKWVLRDISKELKKEGVNLHYSGVSRVLADLGITQKSPILRAPGSINKNYKKRKEIRNYRKIAAALLKKT